MQWFLRGFAAELAKIAAPNEQVFRDAMKDAKRELKAEDSSFLRGGGGPVKRDYLASAVIAGLSAPLMAILGKQVGRMLHNRNVRSLMKGTSNPAKLKRLEGELQMGRLIGRARPDLPAKRRPAITHGELATDAIKGVTAGSILQMISDQLSGARRKDKND